MDKVRATVARIVNGPVTSIEPLAGDASTRRYYRAALERGATVVVMEAPTDDAVSLFVTMTELMRRYGVETPTLIGHEGGVLVQEDLGNTMVQDDVARLDPDVVEVEYWGILDDLVAFQSGVVNDRRRPSAPCFSLAFDVEKLTFETDFARTHFFGGFLHRTLSDEERQAHDHGWMEVNRELAERQETLCHRDFHSRNIMVVGNRRVWIDYQDARMGRFAYDVASLLEDPYAEISVAMREGLFGHYVDLATKEGLDLGADFDRIYRLTAAQRLYKALGTYGYQITANKKMVYLGAIPPALAGFVRVAEEIEPLAWLRETLAAL